MTYASTTELAHRLQPGRDRSGPPVFEAQEPHLCPNRLRWVCQFGTPHEREWLHAGFDERVGVQAFQTPSKCVLTLHDAEPDAQPRSVARVDSDFDPRWLSAGMCAWNWRIPTGVIVYSASYRALSASTAEQSP